MLDHDRGPPPDRCEQFRTSVVAVDLETHLVAGAEILVGGRTDAPDDVVIDGDVELGRRILDVLAFLP